MSRQPNGTSAPPMAATARPCSLSPCFGSAGPAEREEAVKLLASSAKLGNPKAAYNLALLYLDGQTLPQDLQRAAELLRVAADAGNPEAQYALATFYKEGTGIEKDIGKAVRLLQAASLADNVDAEGE